MSKVIYSFSLKVDVANWPLNVCLPLSLHICKKKKLVQKYVGKSFVYTPSEGTR